MFLPHKTNTSSQPQPASESDARLQELLRKWPGIEPSTSFNQGVWCKIQASSKPARSRVTGFWPIPLQTTFAAAVLGIVMGGWAAWISLTGMQQPPSHAAAVPFRTLSESYTDLIGGEMP